MKKYRAVLFDFDGTLIDTNGYIVDSWKYASEKIFGKMVFDVSYLATHFGTPLEFAVEETIKHYNIEGYSVEELCALYREYQKENPTKIGVPFEGITELLKELKEKGIKVGVVTSRTKPTTIAALELNEIDKYFDVIIAVEDTQIHKPLPEPALI